MFKVHYVGWQKIAAVELDQGSNSEELECAKFLAWCKGRGVTQFHNLFLMHDVDFAAFSDFAKFHGWDQVTTELPQTLNREKLTPEEINVNKIANFIRKNPNCSFTQVGEAVGITGKKELGVLLNKGTIQGLIVKRKKNGKFLYSGA